MSQGPHKTHLFDLPSEVIDEIILRLAHINYNSIYTLAKSCRYLNKRCKDFLDKNPKRNFIKYVFDDNASDDYISIDTDPIDRDLDEIYDELDRFSFGSNYDEELDEYLNGPERDYDVGY